MNFLNANDDWIETTRLYLYPRLYDPLSSLGDSLGVEV